VDRVSRRGLPWLTVLALALAASPRGACAQVMVRDVQQPVPVQVKPFQDKAGLMRRAPFEPKLRAEPAAPDVPWAPERLAAVVPDPAFDALVDRLSSPRADERDAATAALRAPSVPIERILRRLSDGGLATEAHLRLMSVARTRILTMPRGALGIQMNAMARRMGEAEGVIVTQVYEEFPASRVLKPGDRIVEIDGRPTPDSSHLTVIIQMKQPGDTVPAVVMRGERDADGRVIADGNGAPLERRVELVVEVGSRDVLDRVEPGRLGMMTSEDVRIGLADRLDGMFPLPSERAAAAVPVPGEVPCTDTHPFLAEVLGEEERSGRRCDPALLVSRADFVDRQAAAPGLGAAEREWFRAVSARLRELAARDAGADAPRDP
jgi:hypothetical protein